MRITAVFARESEAVEGVCIAVKRFEPARNKALAYPLDKRVLLIFERLTRACAKIVFARNGKSRRILKLNDDINGLALCSFDARRIFFRTLDLPAFRITDISA